MLLLLTVRIQALSEMVTEVREAVTRIGVGAQNSERDT